jgi:hypothetical protein
MIEDLTRGSRLDIMCEASPVKEEQFRRQSELRRLRKHERESRDPHRKIEEKLKNRRNSELFKFQQNGAIPMQTIDFGGEHVSMVDVGVLRARCQQNTSAEVRSMLQERSARQNRLVSAANATLRASSSMPVLCRVK